MAETRLEKQLRDWKRFRSDRRLFRHLGQIHRLSRDDLDLLEEIALERRLLRIAEIFVRPSLIESSPDPDRWHDAQVEHLRRRICS